VRAIFFGSPPFALPTLEALLGAGHEMPLVVSQPGKPVGRRAEVTDPPVAARAKSLGLLVFQPPTLKDDAAFARLAETRADVFVVAAYGKILAQRVLDLPRLGCLNVHGSLLPRWRGASPVQAAILAGDAETGVSIMRMTAGMDEGPVYTMRRTEIRGEDDSASLSARIAMLGADALIETLKQITLPPVPQDSSRATYCPKITREDARVDWTRPAPELVRRARAFTPWPGLFTLRGKARLKLSDLSLVAREPRPGAGAGRPSPGEVLQAGARVVVACGEGAVGIAALQAEGRKLLPAEEFVRGERVSPGEVWGGSAT
jgi:methionyl-tRNA formyltransferase